MYQDAEGREIDREVYAGVDDYRLKQEHIDAQLKKYWDHRIDSNFDVEDLLLIGVPLVL